MRGGLRDGGQPAVGLLRLGQNRIRYRAAGRSDRGIGGSGWTRQYRPVDSFRWPLQNSVIKPADLTSSSAERSAPEHFTEPEPISETKKYPRSVGSQFMQFCPVLEGTPPTPNHLCCCTEICAELLRTRTGSDRFGSVHQRGPDRTLKVPVWFPLMMTSRDVLGLAGSVNRARFRPRRVDAEVPNGEPEPAEESMKIILITKKRLLFWCSGSLFEYFLWLTAL